MRQSIRDSLCRTRVVLSLAVVLTLGGVAWADHCPPWLEGLCHVRDAIGECKDALFKDWMHAADECARVRDAMGAAADSVIPDRHAAQRVHQEPQTGRRPGREAKLESAAPGANVDGHKRLPDEAQRSVALAIEATEFEWRMKACAFSGGDWNQRACRCPLGTMLTDGFCFRQPWRRSSGERSTQAPGDLERPPNPGADGIPADRVPESAPGAPSAPYRE